MLFRLGDEEYRWSVGRQQGEVCDYVLNPKAHFAPLHYSKDSHTEKLYSYVTWMGRTMDPLCAERALTEK